MIYIRQSNSSINNRYGLGYLKFLMVFFYKSINNTTLLFSISYAYLTILSIPYKLEFRISL